VNIYEAIFNGSEFMNESVKYKVVIVWHDMPEEVIAENLTLREAEQCLSVQCSRWERGEDDNPEEGPFIQEMMT
jgi:hypothetical protein